MSNHTTNENEFHFQQAYDDEEYLNTQQANQITLEQIKDKKQQETTARISKKPLKEYDGDYDDDDIEERVEDLASNENEHLLGGQEQQQQQHHKEHHQQQLLMKPTNLSTSRVNFKESTIPTVGGSSGKYSQDIKEAGNPNNYPENPLGSQSFIGATTTTTASADAAAVVREDIDLKTHSKLELQKFPKEMLQSQNNINEQNGSTIILTPTSLTLATSPTAGGQNASNGGGNGNNNNDGVYRGPKMWQYLVKHYVVSSQPLAILIIFLVLWILGYVLMPEYAEPSTVIMRIALLFVGAQAAGILVTFIKLPDILGMLFFGVLYTNLGWADFSGYQKFEAFLREMALINIMLLAGLGLDANAFKKLWFMILRLTLVPTVAEVTIIAVLARYLLNMPWLWGILLGLVVTAVSPNVVVTVMLKLKEERLGLNSGIHTLIYAMTTCNDVVAIFLFGVICGVIFSTGSLTEQILQGPVGIGIGIVFGYLYGLMLQFVPSRNSSYVNGLRFVLTILGGAVSVMGSKAIGYPSAGALGCVTVAFIAGIGWKSQQLKLTPEQKQLYENSSVPKRLDLLWKFLKPVSFALIGKEINFAVLDGKVVGYGALLVLLGSLFRLAFAYISTYGGNLSRKERAYITISGFPKATVQAALGPIALDLARSLNADTENLSLASNVLIISVLAIIFTAPLGAILMLRLAPIWLKHSPLSNDNDDNAGHVHHHHHNNINLNNINTADVEKASQY